MPTLAGLDLSDNERLHIGEALIVYLFRALNKPAQPAYFHVGLLDVLVKSVRDSLQLNFGISWAKGTNCLKPFTRRSNLDDHPYAPAATAAGAMTRGENFAQLSEEALKRIATMTKQKRRQLEAIAAAIFPDHESIRGGDNAYEGAELIPGKAKRLVEADNQLVDRVTVASIIQKRIDPALIQLEKSLDEAFSGPTLTPAQKAAVTKELEDILIGRLELEQPQISTELLARLMMRGLKKLGDWIAGGVVYDFAAKATAAIIIAFPILH